MKYKITIILVVAIVAVIAYRLFKRKPKPVIEVGDVTQTIHGANVPDYLFENQSNYNIGDIAFGDQIPGSHPDAIYQLTPDGWRAV